MSHKKLKGIQNRPTTVQNDGHGGESTKRHVYVEPGVQIDLVKNLREEYDANQKKNTAHSKRILFWTIVSAILLFIYSAITGYQASLTRESVKTAQRSVDVAQEAIKESQGQFQSQQRPYIWQASAVNTLDKKGNFVGNIGIIAPDKRFIGRIASAAVRLQNFGHRPAIITKVAGAVRIGKYAVDRLTLDHNWQEKEMIIPEGRVDQLMDIGPDIITAEKLAEYSGSGLAFTMRIQYQDPEGHRFESDICEYTPNGPNDLWDYCPSKSGLNRLIDCQMASCE